MLMVTRRRQHNASRRVVQIVINGDRVGRIANGQRQLYELPAGVHTVEFRVGGLKSGIQFTLAEHQRKELKLSFCNSYLTLLAAIGIVSYLNVIEE